MKRRFCLEGYPIVHVEFATDNPKATGKFLADLFNWQIEMAPEFDYVMFRPNSGPGGGLSPVDNQMYRPGEALVYVGTDDIDATLVRATELGATTLLPKTEIPQTGWFAILSDPSGARVALYENLESGE